MDRITGEIYHERRLPTHNKFPIQIGNLLHAYQERRISWQAVRLAPASVEMLAIREAPRSRPKWKNRPRNQFTKAEFAKLTGPRICAHR